MLFPYTTLQVRDYSEVLDTFTDEKWPIKNSRRATQEYRK